MEIINGIVVVYFMRYGKDLKLFKESRL